jgi:hypothetical protein
MDLRGHCFWAVAPFSPAPPFSIYVEGHPPTDVSSVDLFVEAAGVGNSSFKLLTEVKVRPVIVITDELEPFGDVLALRLKRVGTISDPAARAQVKAHADPHLFYLEPRGFPGLAQENAVMTQTLMRLPVDALETHNSLGSLDPNELRVLHERVATFNGLDLEGLVIPKARQLLRESREE